MTDRNAGPDALSARAALRLAVGAFCLSAAGVAAVATVRPVAALVGLRSLAGGLAALSALLAARGGGLPRVWVVAFGLAAGFGVHLGGIGITGETPGIAVRLGWAVVVGVAGATALGLPGGGIGLGLRRAVRRVAGAPSE
jgi:hypothetical protein